MELRIRGEPTVAGKCAGESNSSARGEEVIRWERFLPRRWLRVLLVENDDSTRHIVAALLRKCSYQVAAVADGLKAWEVLKEKNYNFDLVLTEVSTPSLSGIGLLSKIMSNDICKNVPVIMMSSQDSATIVFKCMLKGAADFLVKPVRKNELQNLWQHVWRKYCSSSSRNVFENGYPNQTGQDAMSNNDAASNCASANACDTANEEGSCEKRNDTQSPCNNMETEFESEENHGKSMLKTVDYDAAKMTTISTYTNRETEGQEINVTLYTREENKVDREVANNMRCIDGTSEWNSDSLCPRGIPDEPSREIIDFIGTRSAGQCSHTIVKGNHHNEDALCKTAKSSHSKESASKGGSSALWELSLRRPQLNNGWAESSFQAKHVLKHSDASAFSRYGNKDLSSTTSGSSLAMLCTRTVESKAGNCHSQSANNEIGNGVTLSFSTNESLSSTIVKGGEALNNKNEELEPLATNTTNKSFFRHGHNLGLFSLPVPIGSIPFQSLCAGSGAIVRPIFYSDPSVPQCGPSSVEKINDVNHSDLQYINHHHYSIYQQCHQLHAMRDQIGDFQLPNSSVFLNAPTEKANQSGAPSRSALDDSGSNGSNEDTNLATNMGTPLRNTNENGFQDCNGQGLDSDRARREAALAKFRLKRKERCFEKKVRYHSRQKLAEQRPRLKGQFVRQEVVGSPTTATER